MSFWSTLNYDHVNGDIIDESRYFPYICDLVDRAREHLDGRNSQEIFEIALFIEYRISLERKNWDHEVALTCRSQYEAEMAETSEYFSDLRMLQNFCTAEVPGEEVPWYVVPEVVHGGKSIAWHESDFFAVLTLMLISDAMKCYDAQDQDWLDVIPLYDGRAKEEIARLSPSEVVEKVKIAARRDACGKAIVAAQAIVHAEQLLDAYERDVDDRTKQSEIASALNAAKHKETYHAKKRILEEWEKDKSKFQSATKAGLYFSDWSRDAGLKSHEPSTITNWIRGYAREKGIKLR